ncbi:DUF6046 domain-containing protein [Gammaproteobacteria bacterium]|nr:DUF6046 domain-containing protein [Gammaproteobacteria bacterium]
MANNSIENNKSMIMTINTLNPVGSIGFSQIREDQNSNDFTGSLTQYSEGSDGQYVNSGETVGQVREMEVNEAAELILNKDMPLASTLFQVPMRFKLDSESESESFLLPFDPIMSISSKNIIVRRRVSKSRMRGSIKERWSQDDYSISISGVLISNNEYTKDEYLKRLRRYCESSGSIEVTCSLLNDVFNIYRIVIESYSFPHTKGMKNQSFSIQAYSDDGYSLLE